LNEFLAKGGFAAGDVVKITLVFELVKP